MIEKSETYRGRSAQEDRHVLVLAAGKSTRFRSAIPKVIHPLCGRPLLGHLLTRLGKLDLEKTLVVIGHEGSQVKNAVQEYGVDFVLQDEALGTGHAVMAARQDLKHMSGSLLILSGDTPLLRTKTLKKLFESREKENADCVLLTARFDNPRGYGRILRDEEGQAVDIVEEKDASPRQKTIREINTGVYCFRIASLIKELSRLSRANAAGEYYLTDLVAIFHQKGYTVATRETDSPLETLGINDRAELSAAEDLLRAEINQKWMRKGVTILNPASVFIDDTAVLANDVRIYPGVLIEGRSRVGSGSVIRSYSHLKDTVLEQGVTVDHCSVLRDAHIRKNSQIGPFAHLRGNSVVGPRTRVGNFVEIKNSVLGEGTKAAHLSYLGDSEIGKNVNIGAGTITCNYDGSRKHRTVIEDGAFTGSNSALVAPLRISRGAYVAAGSTITADVPEYSLAIARGRQVNKEGRAPRKPQKKPKSG